MTRRFFMAPFIAMIAFAAVLAACGDDDDDTGEASAEDVAAVEDVVRSIAETDPADSEQVDFWLAHMSDEVIGGFFGTTRDDCAANAEECIGERTDVDRIEATTVTGDTAVSTIHDANGSVFTLRLARDGDVWQVTAIRFGPAELPEGVTAINLELDEYEFNFDESELTDGNVGFPYENVGEEAHEVLVLKTNDDYDLDEVIDFFGAQQGGDDLPAGVDEIFFLGFAPPGGGGIGYTGEPLPPGDYAFACFFPDPEGTSHAALGMEQEFTVPE